MPLLPTKPVESRLIVRGTIIRLPEGLDEGAVRDVSVVLHMVNGRDVVYSGSETVDVLDPQPELIPED